MFVKLSTKTESALSILSIDTVRKGGLQSCFFDDKTVATLNLIKIIIKLLTVTTETFSNIFTISFARLASVLPFSFDSEFLRPQCCGVVLLTCNTLMLLNTITTDFTISLSNVYLFLLSIYTNICLQSVFVCGVAHTYQLYVQI